MNATLPAADQRRKCRTGVGGHPAFDRVRALFDLSVDKRPAELREAHFGFADDAVRVRVVGDGLASHIFRPFAHLARDPGARVELTIDLWDEEATGVAYGHEPPSVCDGRWRAAGGFVTAFEGGRFFRYEQPAAVTWLDRRDAHIVGWRKAGARLPLHERSKPVPFLLAVWHYDRRRYVVHAGLIADGEQAVLVGGASGQGKSTTTLAAVTHGAFAFLGDDQTALCAAKGAFVGHSLYQSARLDATHVARLPILAAHAVGADEPREKRLMFISDIGHIPLRSEARIQAIVLPSVDPLTVSRVTPATKASALLRIAPTSVYTAFGPGHLAFELLSRLIDRVPSYRLTLGHDLERVPVHLKSLLREAV
jgi:hypothetical protein